MKLLKNNQELCFQESFLINSTFAEEKKSSFDISTFREIAVSLGVPSKVRDVHNAQCFESICAAKYQTCALKKVQFFSNIEITTF